MVWRVAAGVLILVATVAFFLWSATRVPLSP